MNPDRILDVPLVRFYHDLPFPEGPSFNEEGAFFVCARKSGRIFKIHGGARTVFLEIEGQPNGTAFGLDGILYVTDYRGGRLLAVDQNGSWTPFVTGVGGEPLQGPNDLTFDTSGTLYFTDPGLDLYGHRGAVYRVGGSGEAERIASDLSYPNGIAVSPGGSSLLVAETAKNQITRLPRDSNGEFGQPEVFAATSGGIGPDGITFDPDGNLYVANYGAGTVDVFDTVGTRVARLRAGGPKPTNCAWYGGAIYVTEDESASVWRLSLPEVSVPSP